MSDAKAGLESGVTGADVIAKCLYAAGCRFAFGVPGGEVLAVMEALERAGLAFHLVKHENAGGFMAEGVWHAGARKGVHAPGVLLATLGPGVTNAVNVVANAWQDRTPLIFLTGCVDEVDAQTYTHQVFDHQQLLRPIVKGSFRAVSGSLGRIMEKAIALSLEGQPGPVHIDVPISVAEGAVSQFAVPRSFAWRSSPSGPEGAPLTAAKALLSSARRPIALAGVDAVNEPEAGRAIADFCRKFAVPLITTYKAKGLLDEYDPLSLGGAGLSPKADGVLLPLLRESDCILLLGYDPIEMRMNWRDPWASDAPVVELTSTPRAHGMHDVRHTLVGSIAAGLGALSAGLVSVETWKNGALERARKRLLEAFAPEPEGWGPACVFHTLREVMPCGAVATADSGAHRILASQIWKADGVRGMLQSSGLCTMACALPLGVGQRLADPERPVIVFVGDAGLEMGLGELATVRDLNLPLIICVLVDESLALIELKQRGVGRANLGVDFPGTDFAALAQVYGGHGVWVDDKPTLEREARAALSRNNFTLLACRISKGAYDGKF